MTTLVALNTKDALVMGCDSLGSMMKKLVDPYSLIGDFFDPKNNWKLKVDKNGKPILKEYNDIYKKSQLIPYDQMTHVTKMFSLSPLEMGVMVSGITSIEDRTIKSLINEFKSNETAFNEKVRPTNYTVKSIGTKLLSYIYKFYKKAFLSKSIPGPPLEFMIGGYDKQKRIPTIYRIYVDRNKLELPIKYFGIVFGGQMLEIQRIVFGIDPWNVAKLIARVNELFDKYHDFLQDFLKKLGITVEIPLANTYKDELNLLNNWEFDGFIANWGDFSEQNAIECVNFFVEIMIRSQQFSSMMPTVGGSVHIGLITKEEGFRFISREEYEHEGFRTPL